MSPQPASRRSPPHIATLVALTGASAMAMNIFLPALPQMTAYFQTDYGIMQLAISLYLGVNAVMQILLGPISDKLGRRPVILWGLALFMLATLGCIYAPNAAVFLGFRMGQSVIVAAMILSRAAIRDRYSAEQAASLIGYVTMGMAVVPMVAPAIGGFLSEAYGWQAIFWLLVLVAAAVFMLTYIDFGETKSKSGLSLAQQFREYPELLRSPRFWGYAMASALSSGAFFAYQGGAPFVGANVFEIPPTELGMFFGAPAIGYFVGNFLSGRYSARIGINRMVLWGCMLCVVGTLPNLALALLGLSTEWSFFGIMVIVGVGNGMTIPNATAGALSVRPHLAATASGLSGALMLGGGGLLSALSGWLVQQGSAIAPLLAMMTATSIAAVCAILIVIRRERQLGL